MIFPVYVLVKYLAYSLWCYLGLRWLRDRKSVGAGVAFGSVRLGLGMIFGVGIFVIGGMLHLNAPSNSWLAYLAVYVPVRYVEWSILAALLGARRPIIFDRRRGNAAMDHWRNRRLAFGRPAADPLRRRRAESFPSSRPIPLLAHLRNGSQPAGFKLELRPFDSRVTCRPRVISPMAVSGMPLSLARNAAGFESAATVKRSS